MDNKLKIILKYDLFPIKNMHLQWFAAEDEGRTEDPTQQKLKKSREEGKVAKSADLTSSLVLFFSVSAMIFLSTFVMENIRDLFLYFFKMTNSEEFRSSAMFLPLVSYLVKITLPLLLIGFLGAIFGNLIQVGFLFTFNPIKPNLKRIVPNFKEFFRKSFFSMEALFNLAKSIIKVIIVSFIAYLNIKNNIFKFSLLSSKSIAYSLLTMSHVIAAIFMQISIFFIVLSLFDYLFERRKFLESMKMTKHELKEERKTYEGDPLVKSRIKQRMQEILKQNMVREVPKADVVITNPTHFAVALEYKRETMSAPTVIAKGQDNLAFRIRDIARENAVPVIENRFLARSIYADVEIGEEIPEKYYEAVVIVLKEVFKMNKNKNRAW